MLSDPRRTPRSYPELPPGDWTIPLVRSAIANLERGYLSPASRLTRALSRDPRYVQGREQFVGAVQGCPADVVAAPISYGGVGTARKLAEEAGPMLGRVLADGAESWLIEWGKVCNLAIGVLTWDTTARPWTPVSLTRWPLEAVRVDLYQRRMWAQTTDGGGEIEIVPGDGTWVVYAPRGLYGFDAAMLRCFAEAFVGRRLGVRDLGNRAQAASVAAIVAKLRPGDASLDSPEAIAIEEKLRALQTGAQAGILLPGDMPDPTALDLATKGGHELFKTNLETVTTDLLVPWLMQDGTATNEGGSLAKAQVLDGVLMSTVQGCVSSLWGEERADKSHAPGCITEQIVRPWALYQGADPRTVPLALRRVPDLDEDARLTAEAQRAEAWRAEVEGLRKLGYEITDKEARELAEARGVRLPTGLVMVEVRTPEPAPPVPPTDERPPGERGPGGVDDRESEQEAA